MTVAVYLDGMIMSQELAARLAPDVVAFAEGYETMVGKRGGKYYRSSGSAAWRNGDPTTSKEKSSKKS